MRFQHAIVGSTSFSLSSLFYKLLFSFIIGSFYSRRSVFVIQTGAWEIDFWPPRGIIKNPASGAALLRAIEMLKLRNCSGNVRIVWLGAQPPAIFPYDAIPWRNRHSINAVNEFFRRELEKIKYPNLVSLNVHDLIRPLLMPELFSGPMCHGHFICHFDYRSLLTLITALTFPLHPYTPPLGILTVG